MLQRPTNMLVNLMLLAASLSILLPSAAQASMCKKWEGATDDTAADGITCDDVIFFASLINVAFMPVILLFTILTCCK
jgi:hypothetical protein